MGDNQACTAAKESKATHTLRDIRELRGLSLDILTLAERTRTFLIGDIPKGGAGSDKTPEAEPEPFFDKADFDLRQMRIFLLNTRDSLLKIVEAVAIGK